MNCDLCKCSKCGRVNECFIVAERLELLDETQETCQPLIECSEFTAYKERNRHRTWECMIRKEMERRDE